MLGSVLFYVTYDVSNKKNSSGLVRFKFPISGGMEMEACVLKWKSGVKWIWDMFSVITSWSVVGEQKNALSIHS